MATSAVKVPVISLKQIAAKISEDYEISKKDSEEILGNAVSQITSHLRSGSKIRLIGLGTFVVRNRSARQGRNPATGAIIQIAASKKVAFRPAKELKESI